MTVDNSIIEEAKKYDWYQSIRLSDDYITPGETGDSEQWKLEMMALPDDMSGKSVLDIGCNEGFYSFEFEKRGASPILAVDKSVVAAEKFNLLKRAFSSKIEFKAMNLLQTDPPDIGKFDIVLFLAVFHHLRYPILALDRVADLTKELAIMEFVEAVPREHEDQSVLVRKMSKKGHLHMLPTRNYTLEILEQAGFKRVEVIGTHRFHKIKPKRKMPGYDEQRVLIKAHINA